METSPSTKKRGLVSVLRAAVFATVVVGGLASGLGITTYTVAKANEAVFGSPGPTALVASAQCPTG